MCLNIQSGTKIQTAKKDLYTYKWMLPFMVGNQYGTYLSKKYVKAPFRRTKYEFNKEKI